MLRFVTQFSILCILMKLVFTFADNGIYNKQNSFYHSEADVGFEKHSAESDVPVLSVMLDKIVNTVDERYISITLDSSMVAEHWPCFDFRSVKLVTLAKAFSPGYIRLGGNAADFLVFRENQKVFNFHHQKCDIDLTRRNYSTFYMTGSDFDNINQFANHSGLRLMFDLNVLLRNPNDQWNSFNAETLLKYAIRKNYSQNLDLELGNEPNSFAHAYHRNVSAYQLGKDFRSLRTLLDHLPQLSNSLLVGPSVTQPKKRSLEYLRQFLTVAKHSVDAITVHHYYIDGRTATVDEMTSVKVLNDLSSRLIKLQKVIKATGYESVPVWLGETASCWGGGAPGLSDRYVAGFMWLDKLGVAAKCGIRVVMRQSFFHGHYALIDNSLNPNPDFWLTWLYKRLVGRRVLSVNNINVKYLRMYAHCTSKLSSLFREGSVTLYALNLSRENKTVTFGDDLLKFEKHIYWLLPHGTQGLKSKLVSLSGQVLRLIDNNTLPEPRSVAVPGGQSVQLPASSFGFIVIPDANVPVCKQ